MHRHLVVPQVSEDPRAQPRAHHRDRVMQTAPKFGFHLPQLRLQSLPLGLPKHREPTLPRSRADMRETEEVEGLRLPQADTLPTLGRTRAELQQARLLRVQL